MDTPLSFTYKDILLRKLSYSVTCSVLSQLVILNVYIFFSNVDLFHPVNWVLSTIRIFTSFTTWLFVVPFLTVILAQSVICAKDYVVKQTYCSTRFQKFLSAFSVHNLLLLILHVIVGATSIWMFLRLADGKYSNLTKKCQEKKCLNEGTFYLITSGFFVGCFFFIKVYISEKHLCFPTIHQRKFLQLKSEISTLIKDSVVNSFWPALYFIVFYHFWGKRLSQNVIDVFGISPDEEPDRIKIYLYLWLFGALYYFNMNLMRFFFNLFLTEPMEFPLVKNFPATVTLQESIVNNDWPIIQSLACLDLFILSRWSKVRRQVFFSLSQPGGHPHNWNSLVENILKLFNEYTDLLNKSTTDVTVDKKPLESSCLQPFSPDRFRNLRPMALRSPESYNVVTITRTTMPEVNFLKNLNEKLMKKVYSVYSFLKMVLGINFLFGELPQANVQKCLGNGHLVIWASQGISEMTSVAMVEDKFGIVQKDLPAIVTTLVNLKQSLDKLNKTPALTRKIAGFNDFNYRMKGALSSAIKRSLFNICNSYAAYLNDFPLSKEVVHYLQTCVIYKH